MTSVMLPDSRLERPSLLTHGRKPAGPVEVDWSHPFLNTGRAAYIGNGGLVYFVVNGIELISGTQLLGVSYNAAKWQLMAGTQTIYGANPLAGASQDSVHVLAKVKMISTIGSVNYDTFLNHAAYVDNTNNSGFFIACNQTDKIQFTLLSNSTTAAYEVVTSRTAVEGEELTIYAHWNAVAGSLNLYVYEWDETATNASPGISSKYDGVSDGLLVGRATAGRQVGVEYAIMWAGDRVTRDQIDSLAKNPYQFLVPV